MWVIHHNSISPEMLVAFCFGWGAVVRLAITVVASRIRR